MAKYMHVYTDMHVGHVPDVVLRLSCTGGGDSWWHAHARLQYHSVP